MSKIIVISDHWSWVFGEVKIVKKFFFHGYALSAQLMDLALIREDDIKERLCMKFYQTI